MCIKHGNKLNTCSHGKDATNMFKEKESAEGMELMVNRVAMVDATTMQQKEECASGIAQSQCADQVAMKVYQHSPQRSCL